MKRRADQHGGRQPRSRNRGAVLVETVVVLPLLLALILETAEFGHAFWQYSTLTKSVRDGARFAVPASEAQIAADALSRTAKWAQRDLDLDLRVGMTSVAEVRAAGFDARAAFWQASENVEYAMFSGGGMEWAEAQLKTGAIELQPAGPQDDPDLSGLSCQWGPIAPSNGNILSLIMKPAPHAASSAFAQVSSKVISILPPE